MEDLKSVSISKVWLRSLFFVQIWGLGSDATLRGRITPQTPIKGREIVVKTLKLADLKKKVDELYNLNPGIEAKTYLAFQVDVLEYFLKTARANNADLISFETNHFEIEEDGHGVLYFSVLLQSEQDLVGTTIDVDNSNILFGEAAKKFQYKIGEMG